MNMKRVQLFNGRYAKGVPFVKNSIEKGLDLGAKPLPAKLWSPGYYPCLVLGLVYRNQEKCLGTVDSEAQEFDKVG